MVKCRIEIFFYAKLARFGVLEHEVILATQNQTITIKHEAHSRALFAEGALAAAEYLVGRGVGLHDMKSIVAGEKKSAAMAER